MLILNKGNEMKIDSQKIIEKYKQKEDRMKTSLFLSQKIYSNFKKNCKRAKVRPNQIVEDLMEQFNNSID